MMKKIEAIIRPTKLDEIRHALEELGCPGITVTEVEGHGRQKGVVRQWRGKEYKVELLSKTKIEVVVKDADVDRIVKTIIEVGKTGDIGDGKIFICPVETVYKIRTGEKGDDAI